MCFALMLCGTVLMPCWGADALWVFAGIIQVHELCAAFACIAQATWCAQHPRTNDAALLSSLPSAQQLHILAPTV